VTKKEQEKSAKILEAVLGEEKERVEGKEGEVLKEGKEQGKEKKEGEKEVEKLGLSKEQEKELERTVTGLETQKVQGEGDNNNSQDIDRKVTSQSTYIEAVHRKSILYEDKEKVSTLPRQHPTFLQEHEETSKHTETLRRMLKAEEDKKKTEIIKNNIEKELREIEAGWNKQEVEATVRRTGDTDEEEIKKLDAMIEEAERKKQQ